MNLRELQERAVKFWEEGRKKSGTFSGPLKKIMLRGANGRNCPICGDYMEHYQGLVVDHTKLQAATIEHILPRSLGGKHDQENLIVICKCCNLSRGLVYNNLTLNRVTLFRYVEWLVLQIKYPHQSMDNFPHEHALFIRHWQDLSGRKYSPPQIKNVRNRRKRVQLDMSASARLRRQRRLDSIE